MDAETVTERIDLQDYIGQYCDLEERNGDFWTLSPFTNEKTPSFKISGNGKDYYDFSSGHGGGVIQFIMRYHRMDYDTALLEAAKFAGIDPNDPRYRSFESTKVLKRLSRKGKEPNPGLGTILDPHVMDRYEFDLDKLSPWVDEGISPEVLDRFQIRYDPHSNSIVYPVRDAEGNILVIGSRTLDPDWKAKKMRKYVYLSKWGSNTALWGLWENREAILERREAIVFEGAKSVMKCNAWGIGNTVAALTSRLNDHQLRMLIELGCDVVIAFDKGVDVWKDATVRKLRHFVNVSAVVDGFNLLEDKMSPVDAGKDVFLKLYEGRVIIK